MNEKTRKVAKKIWKYSPEIVAIVALSYVAYRSKGHRLVPIEGHFIAKADFERILRGKDSLVLLTPLGDFRVIPV